MGLRLSATLIFDHPSPVAVARYLLEQIAGTGSVRHTRETVAVKVDDPIAIVGTWRCRRASSLHLWKVGLSGQCLLS